MKSDKTQYDSAMVTVLVFLFFAVGYLLSAGKLAACHSQYLLMNITSAVLVSAALFKLRKSDVPPPVWLTLFVLLLFGNIKFYWIAFDPGIVRTFFPANMKTFFSDPVTLLHAFSVQTVSLAAYCVFLVVFFAIRGGKGAVSPRNVYKDDSPCPGAAKIFTSLVLILMPVAVWLVYRYKIGVLGMPSKPLPLHLSGLIFYSLTIVIPVFILAQIYTASRSGNLRLSRAGGLLLLLWAIADAVLRTSRGSLLLAPLFILFLALNRGLKFRRIEVGAVFCAGCLAVFFLPLITKYRVLRMSGVTSLGSLAYLFYNFPVSPQDVISTLSFLLFRIPGVETIVVILGFKAQPIGTGSLSVIFSSDGLSGYLTHVIMGIPAEQPIGYAASFLGGAYLAGGYFAVILALTLAGLIATVGWNKLKSSELESLPVAQAFFLVLLFGGITEGVSPILLKQAVVAAATLAVCEAIMRGRAVLNFLSGVLHR